MISSCCSFFCIVVANGNDSGLHYNDQINSDVTRVATTRYCYVYAVREKYADMSEALISWITVFTLMGEF
jgi:hypothetical protein